MATSTAKEEQRLAALYWLGNKLIDYRHPVSVIVLAVTGIFAYLAFQLKLETSFGDLLPQSHSFIKIHNKYSKSFGGANNIVVMFKVKDGTIFTVENLTRIFYMTDGMDRVYGVNHNQIESIGHRTVRHLRVAAGGTLRAEPVMLRAPRGQADVEDIRRIVHNSENIYGLLVSLDDSAALIRANFIERRLDYRRIFDDVNQKVVDPYGADWTGRSGWCGLILKPEQLGEKFPPTVKLVVEGTAAAEAGFKVGDILVSYGDNKVESNADFFAMVKDTPPGERVKVVVKRGGEKGEEVTLELAKGEPDVEIYTAGEPRLYGWVYLYANDVFWILVVTYCIEWVLRWMYFHDWRGSLRPTITGVIAAFWGLGFIKIIGLPLDPLMLVMPFLITARAVSHAIQMHDRYYEEYKRSGWDKRQAIVGAFAELFVPTLSGIVTDALGILVIMLVPVITLQKLAITASWWILAITVSEMLLNPIVYYYLKAPEQELVEMREVGWFRRFMDWFTDRSLSPFGRKVCLGAWIGAVLVGGFFLRELTFGDPTAASPLLWLDSPYNMSHARIQDNFGGVEPLIVVAEGFDKDAMKDPQTLRTMERFQRYLEGDEAVGYSFSLADIIRAVNAVFHELEPKWGVIPDSWVDVGGLFFIFFSGSPPTETAKYVSTDYSTAHVTFYCRNHQGETIRRIIARCEQFIRENPMDKAAFKLAGGLIGVLAAANQELIRNDVLMNLLGFGVIYIILLFTYRSFVAGLYLLAPLICSNILVNAYMGFRNIGINIHTLPLVTVGVGFGIDYGLYIVSRAIEEIRVLGDLHASVKEAMRTSGKAVTFTAVTMVFSTFLWVFSHIRFDAEMGGLLALWMLVSYIGSQTLLPVLILLFPPKFILKEASEAKPQQG